MRRRSSPIDQRVEALAAKSHASESDPPGRRLSLVVVGSRRRWNVDRHTTSVAVLLYHPSVIPGVYVYPDLDERSFSHNYGPSPQEKCVATMHLNKNGTLSVARPRRP